MPSGVNPGDDGLGVSTAGAATVNHSGGTITTESLTTAAAADYSFVLTNNNIGIVSVVHITVGNGTNTTTPYVVHSVQVAAGSVSFKVRNLGASAFNGTLVISFTAF